MRRGDSASAAYVKEAAVQAHERLQALAEGRLPGERLLSETDSRTDLAARFRLEPGERRLLDFLLGVERSLDAGRLVRQISGRGRPTVELLRLLLGEEVDRLLAAGGRLRVHGLCVVSCLPAGLAEGSHKVGLAPGLASRLAGFSPTADELGPGIELLQPPAARPVLPEALAEAVREHLVALEPGWVTVSGARVGDAGLLGGALAHRLARPVVIVDGRVVGGLAEAWSLLASVRRESDLTDAPLIVEAAGALHGAWRALVARPPEGGRAKPIVILNVDGEAPAPAGFTSHAVEFVGRAPPPPKEETEKPVDRLEAARRQAAIDAARALGKPVPGVDEPLRKAIQRDSWSSSSSSPSSSSAPAPAAAAAPVGEAESAPARDRAAAREAAAALEASAPREPAAVREAAAAREEGVVLEDPAVERARARVRARREAEAAAAVVEEGPPVEYPPDPGDELPYVDVPAEATVADLVRIAYQAANPKQKAELITKLSGGVKDVLVLKMLRAFATATQPRIKAAAEAGLVKMFGATYGKAKAIAPPVQPPRTDDD